MKGMKTVMKKSLAMVSALTMTCLYGLLAAFVILICLLMDASVLTAIIWSIVILIIQFLISPWLTDLSMKWFYKADFNYELPAYLESFVKEIAEKYNMKKLPKVGFINDGAPNAFTYGRTKNDARIIITRGIIDLLDEDEAKGVVGHELGHVVHYDMLLMTVAQIVPLVFYGIYEISMESAKDSKPTDKEDDKGNVGLAAIGLVAYVLYLICQLIILWFSRTREYYADEFSAKETRNPNALASALVKIGYGLAVTGKTETENKHSVASPSALGIADAKFSKEMAVCCASDEGEDERASIQNAMKWDMWNLWAKLYEMLSTHPLISKRLLAISKLSPEFGQEPYITFDLEKPESYTDDFVKECFIDGLPGLGIIAAFIIILIVDNPNLFGFAVVIPLLLGLFKYRYRHPTKNMAPATVRDLLGEVKVSDITPVPCEVSGEVIGRGNPGCIFNEDFVIKDSTGIIMLNYSQPLFVLNKFFALFRSQENFGKTVKISGWYRRAPVPYIDIKTMEVDGKVKKCWTYQFGYVWRIVLLAIALFFSIAVLL